MQNQPLARRKTNSKVPLLPANVVTVDDEARTLRLVNFDGFQIRPRTNDLGGVVGFFGWQRHDPEVLDGNDLHRMQVNNRDDVLNWSRVAVVVRS